MKYRKNDNVESYGSTVHVYVSYPRYEHLIGEN